MSITSVICPSASDAARVLASNNRARFFGGGTLLMRSINEGDQSFDTIVRINDPIMMQIQNAGRQLIIGAGVTMSGLLSNRDAQFLASAARSVGGPAIRNMATVGGNLFAPSPYGDFTTALIALDGIATLADGSTVPLADFLLKRKNDHTSIVTQISVNRPNSADEFHFLKVSRVKPKGIAASLWVGWA